MNFHLHPSFNPTRTSIVTPKFWGGYFLPAENAELTARYYPAINQVWINSNLTEIDIEFAHIHECLHCFTSCFQPAQLLALQAELTGKIRIPTSKQFEDFR